MSIKISIITVSKNSIHFIEETILSVLNQTYKNIEYILIDGASQDGTMDIIRRYTHKISYWISEADSGMYDAINKGLAKANGDYILILNSDDVLADAEVVENVVNQINIDHCQWYYGDIIKRNDKVLKRVRMFDVNYRQLLYSGHGTFVPHPCFFISNSLNKKLNGYNAYYKYASDYDYILRALQLAPDKGRHISMGITKFRIHAKSITASGRIEEERKKILRQHGYYKANFLFRYCTFLLLWFYYKTINTKSTQIVL